MKSNRPYLNHILDSIAIHPIVASEDTITLRRAHFERMLAAIEEAEDVAALATAEAREREIGQEAARADAPL